jgi:arylsulfatase A
MSQLAVRLAAAFITLVVSCCLSAADSPPNVVLILIDDMGFTDLSCYGSKFYETPHIDRLAAGGMRLTHGYSACTVCSPTRSAIMTGKYPARLHITDWIAGHQRPYAKLKVPDWRMYLPHEEVTIGETFKANGYATCHIGKWHLGGEEYAPTTNGFDINVAGTHVGSPPTYFFPYKNINGSLPGLQEGKPGEYLTDRLTDEAIKFITAAKDQPFFLYMPFYAVHTPLMGKPEKVAKYEAKAKANPENPQHHATYGAMVESLDEGIGRLVAHLENLKLRDNTIVVFTSDNGGLKLNQVTSNDPARAGKGSAYEGGVRVPYIFSYPPKIRAGSTSDAAVMSIDLFPTLIELCGLTRKPAAQAKHSAVNTPIVDGISVASVLTEKGPIDRDALYWHYPHYHPGGATPYGAVRTGDWRLVEFYEDGKTELYNLKDDIGESKDLTISQRSKRDQLLGMLQKWRSQIGAQMPTQNPDYDAQRDAQQPAGKGKRKAKS